jgi:hypothetical protein
MHAGRWAALLLAAVSLRGCTRYEYEHEFWLKTDGSGSVYVTGRPALWTAFKRLGDARDPEGTATREAARTLFERSGLRVRRVTLTHRDGNAYLFVSADFDDVSRLAGSPAFPDLELALRPEGDRLRLEGRWRPASATGAAAVPAIPGLMAVRFHLPSKVYEHRNAASGVERGNIVGWRQDLEAARQGTALEFGAVMDRRSILWSTIGLFGGAITLALATLGGTLWIVRRRGRATSSPSPASGS